MGNLVKWVIGILIFVLIVFAIKCSVKKDDKTSSNGDDTNANKNAKTEVAKDKNSFPDSGKEWATEDAPIKAFLDPLDGFYQIWGEGDAKLVFASNKSIEYICNSKPTTDMKDKKAQEWWSKPKGNWLIYPKGVSKILVSWGKK